MAQVTKRHPASNTYARALLEIAQEAEAGDAFADQLSAFAAALGSDRQMRVFFESPKIPCEEKKKVLTTCLTGKVSPPVLNLLQILLDKGRQGLFSEVAEVFGELLDEARGRLQVSIASAKPLSDSARDNLVALLKERTGGEIIASETVDADLLGGMTVRIGDTVIDGSLRTKLKHVGEAMSAPRLGRNLLG